MLKTYKNHKYMAIWATFAGKLVDPLHYGADAAKVEDKSTLLVNLNNIQKALDEAKERLERIE